MTAMSAEVLSKLSAAAMYGVSSLLIMFVNKFALTVYGFPSFTALGLVQCIATVALLAILKLFKVIKFPDFEMSVLRRLFPLPLFFILNVLAGLGGTQRINVSDDCFSVLVGFGRAPSWHFAGCYVHCTSPVQHSHHAVPKLVHPESVRCIFSVRFCLLFRFRGMSLSSRRGSSALTKYSIFLMVLGAVIAAAFDLTFDLVGVMYVLANDVLTSLVGVLMEKKMDAKDFNSGASCSTTPCSRAPS